MRTNDDAIRFYAGSVDGWLNWPTPPRGEVARGAHVGPNVVVSHMFNGAVVQLGWQSAGVAHARVDGLDVTGAEWYAAALTGDSAIDGDEEGSSAAPSVAVDGAPAPAIPSHTPTPSDPSSWLHDSSSPNNALLSLVSPQYDVELAQHHHDVLITNVRVDTSIGSLLRLGLYAPTKQHSTVRGLRIANVSMRQPLRYLRVSANRSRTGRRGDNFVSARAPNSIDVCFSRMVMYGKHIQSDEQWNMGREGKLVSMTYE